jgi:RHH-type transcriptional regulator, rel operon repressor / antitoxin RelB
VRRTAENKLKVVAVRVDPAIEARLRVLAEVTGRKQSFFLQQMIESGIGALEETWLSPEQVAQARSGALQPRQPSEATNDLFSALDDEPAEE